MSTKKKTAKAEPVDPKANESAPIVQPITETLEKNYMPYAMSVIISRAIPEIDGFKPSHRKLLFTMYKMGLLSGNRTKSANIVGTTMKLNPHGDSSIYETMVRLTVGNGALLHPFVDSKGNFGKQYSRDMAYAASRYTEAKLTAFCNELFSGIDKDSVDFVPNYDNTQKEPTLLPTTFPNILVSPNLGIAVGMASNICSFNLAEICDGTVALLKNPKTSIDRLMEIIKAPDFPGGAEILYDAEKMRKIFETGRGSIKMRSKYVIHEKEHTIDVLEIPYSSCIENIISDTQKLIKAGKLREVTDMRDAIDLSGFKITIDIRKDADPEIVIKKLFAATELENTFDCNFNVLIGGTPKTLGVKDLLLEWINFRTECKSRELRFDLKKKQDKLHLLLGLAAILLDIDKAIRIIRGTELEDDVVPNLAKAFDLSQVQAEYIADIKLRNLNRQYIINKVQEIEDLRREIAEIEAILKDELKLKDVLIAELHAIKKKYGAPRKTAIIAEENVEAPVKNEDLFFENYNCRLLLTGGGYFKKLSVQTVKNNEAQKLKEGDYVAYEEDTDNKGDVLFFTDKAQIWRARVCDFDLIRASAMGDYVPAKLGMDDDEHVVAAKMIYEIVPDDHIVYIFKNGKGVRVPMSVYDAKSRRRKITGACFGGSPLVGAFYEPAGKTISIFLRSDNGKAMLIKSSMIPEKVTRTSSGVQLFAMGKKGSVELATDRVDAIGEDAQKCRKLAVPSTGVPTGKMKFNF